MSQLVKSNGGTWYLDQAGQWVPVSDEFAAKYHNDGAAAALGRGAQSVGAKMGGGAMEIMGNALGYEGLAAEGQRIQDVATEYSAPTAAAHPVANFVGETLPYVAAGTLTGTLPGIMAAEATLGALSNPDAPVKGAAVGAAAGGTSLLVLRGLAYGARGAKELVKGRRAAAETAETAEAAGRADAGPGSIVGTTTAEQAEAGQRGLVARVAGMFGGEPPSQATLQRAKQLGIKLSPADKKGSVAQKNLESGLQRNPTAQAVFDSAIKEPNQKLVNSLYRRAIGLDPGDVVTPADLGAAVDQVRTGYQNVAKQIGNVNMQGAVNKQSIAGKINLPESKAAIEGTIDNLPTGTVRADEAFELLSQMRDEAASAWRSGSTTVGQGLDDIADAIENHILANSPPAVQKTLDALRRRWKMIRLGERGSALTEEGDVAFMGMRQNLRNSKFTKTDYRRNRSFGDPASDDFVDSIKVLSEFRERIGNSGTPTGNIDYLDPRTYLGAPLAHSYLRGGLPGAAVGAGATGVGLLAAANAILGD